MPPIRILNPDETPLPDDRDDSAFSPVISREEALWKLHQATNKSGFPWWWRWLWEDALIWANLAAASSAQAGKMQASVRIAGKRACSPPREIDIQEQTKQILKQIKADPSALERRWTEIQRLIFLELQNGDNSLALGISRRIKAWRQVETKAMGAIQRGDGTAFSDVWESLPNENTDPGGEGYASVPDRYLVSHWVNWVKHLDGFLPPFCCWTNDALKDHFIARFGWKTLGGDYFEDRLSAFNLIKIPELIVTIGKNSQITVLDPPPHPSADRRATICRKITPTMFRLAFSAGKSALGPAILILQIDRETPCLTDETRGCLERVKADFLKFISEQ